MAVPLEASRVTEHPQHGGQVALCLELTSYKSTGQPELGGRPNEPAKSSRRTHDDLAGAPSRAGSSAVPEDKTHRQTTREEPGQQGGQLAGDTGPASSGTTGGRRPRLALGSTRVPDASGHPALVLFANNGHRGAKLALS